METDDLVARLERASDYLRFANGSSVHADNVDEAAARISALEAQLAARDAEIERLLEVICAVVEARDEEDFEALIAAISDAQNEATLTALRRANVGSAEYE